MRRRPEAGRSIFFVRMSFESQRGLVTIDSLSRRSGMASALTQFRPRALLLWWAERDKLCAHSGNRGGIGIHVDGGGAMAHAWFADDRVATGAVAHAVGDFAMYSLASPLASAPACFAEALLRDDGFALHWSATTHSAWDVHYLAFGGSDLREAAIANLELVHDHSRIVADVGFRPDFALFVPTAAGGSDDPAPGLFYGIGVAAGPHRQGATGVAVRVADARTVVRSAQCADSVVALPSVEGGRPFRALARIAELGPSGPALAVDLDRAASPVRVACLALAGGRYSVAMHVGPPRPRRDRTRGVGFSPVGVLAFSWGLASSADTKEVPRLSVGAADRGGCGCLGWTLRSHGLWPLEPRSRSTEGRLLEVMDTGSDALHAHARFAGVRADGFTLEWPQSDGHRREFVYAAFGSTEPTGRWTRWREVVRRLLGTVAGKQCLEDRFSNR
jgi:hypothetical protein